LLRYIGERLSLPTPTIASLRTLYQRYKTLYDHQVWACEYLGLTSIGPDGLQGLEVWMQQDAGESLTLDELIQHARCWLYERKILIPAERTLRDLGRTIWAGIERDLLARIDATVTEAQLVRADAALRTQHGASGMTVLEWLKTPPARHSPTTITETFGKIHFLKDLGTHTWTLDAIPLEKQRVYAQRIQARRPAKTRELEVSTRTIELVFFLRVTLLELTDSLLYQTGRRVCDLVRHAYDRTKTKQARSAVEYRQQLIVIKALVHDTSRPAEERLADIGKLLEDLSEKAPASHAASVRETLADDHHRIRNLLLPLRELAFAGGKPSRACGSSNSLASCTTAVRPSCRVTVMCRSAPVGATSSRAMIASVHCEPWKPLRSRACARVCAVARCGSITVCLFASATCC
jgi:Domain of unknown function (DUF4158)